MTEEAKNSVVQKLANDTADLFKVMGDSNATQALENLRKVMHTSSSSHIQSTTSGRGFNSLTLEATHVTNEVLEAKYSKWVEIVTRQASLPAALKPKVIEALEELEVSAGNMDAQRVDFFFKNGSGTVSVLRFVVTKLDNGNYKTVRSFMSSSFSLAPDVMVIRKTKESFFSSKTWDEIRYIERGITSEDAKELLKITGNMLVPMICN